MENRYNPIRSVDGVEIPAPGLGGYRWKLQDVSSESAGRTEEYVMDKMRWGQVVGLELKWVNVSIEDGAAILKAFNPQYVTVEYLDALQGEFRTAVFYVGDRAAPLYNGELGVWSEINFNLIERAATKLEGGVSADD